MFYTLSFLYFWWNGTICFSFFQETRLPSVSEEECSLWVSHGLDPLQDLLCSYPLSGPVSPWSSLPSCPVVAGLRTCTFRVPNCPSCSLTVYIFFYQTSLCTCIFIQLFHTYEIIINLFDCKKKQKKKQVMNIMHIN